ncbi:hypothetical protein BN946_scf184952.g8 [Trametes cinnabarina]|uniref:ATP-dependent DNA helicase n=1 Tax=Pycnoporus cinnabarinus TaxID=5643 RepID=A0A060SUT6_PYCCI|nr:hypothetical protein BN946_scf184952.g8 [Trametes cinnabarina]
MSLSYSPVIKVETTVISSSAPVLDPFNAFMKAIPDTLRSTTLFSFHTAPQAGMRTSGSVAQTTLPHSCQTASHRHCTMHINYRHEFSTILRGRRLFQQYAVDVWAAAEQQRLNWVRNNQGHLRAMLYSGLEDALRGGREVDLNELGRMMVLPSSFIGGPRYMQQIFQDSMAIARYFKRVDLFLTMTANLNWPEVTRELLPGQTAIDRPDLVARVFYLKKEALLKEIFDDHIFGKAVARVYTIEFQKRGLPHMHLLIFLDRPYKLLDADAVDSVIRATWPDPVTEPALFESVKSFMVHGPCGVLNPNAPCMQNGRCSKGFPKPFQNGTSLETEGYPLYHRPQDGRAFQVRNHLLDNRWIVPYNPYLLTRFNCHINVESSVTFASLKYISKYIHKGHDRGTLEVRLRDEVKDYLDSRYIAAPEALWQLYQFELQGHRPPVMRLQVHLPGRHLVAFDPNEDPQAILDRAASEHTTLTAYFAANADEVLGPTARQYTYQEFPQHFTWKKETRSWGLRRSGFSLGRMYFVSPNAGELFYLRWLLTIRTGATSFEALRTVNGIVHPTFHATCLALGLLEDDSEWRQCLKEAVEMHTVYDYGLFLLDKVLRQIGTRLSDIVSMPQPRHDWAHEAENPFLTEQLDYDIQQEHELAIDHIARLNVEQRAAFDCIVHSVLNHSGKVYFLDGPGGTGKTFLYRTLCHKLRSEGLIVLCVAASGIASLLLPGGRTAHSRFKIPVEHLSSHSTCNVNKESPLAEMLRRVSLIIWDEAANQHRFAPEAVERTLRDLRNTDAPFGGITIVFGGDFRQIPPVVVRGSREQVVSASLRSSFLWPSVEVLALHRNMRLEPSSDSAQFAQWLLEVGQGTTHVNGDHSKVQLPSSMLCSDLDSLLCSVYGDLRPFQPQPPPPQYFLNRTILSARNEDVDNINDLLLGRMPGEVRTYYSADTVTFEPGADGAEIHQHRGPQDHPYPPEYLRSLRASGLPLGELRLKVGCPIILLRNLAPSRGLCNGTRMVIVQLLDRLIEARIIGGQHDGELALIPRITLNPTDSNGEFPFRLSRRQFPVRLAFAMSINKAQGQSVKYVGLDLRVPVFSHGQLYVALSRSTSPSHIHALLSDDLDGRNGVTKNIVYPEILLNV